MKRDDEDAPKGPWTVSDALLHTLRHADSFKKVAIITFDKNDRMDHTFAFVTAKDLLWAFEMIKVELMSGALEEIAKRFVKPELTKQ